MSERDRWTLEPPGTIPTFWDDFSCLLTLLPTAHHIPTVPRSLWHLHFVKLSTTPCTQATTPPPQCVTRPFCFIRPPCQSIQNCQNCLLTISKVISNIFVMHHLITNVHILLLYFSSKFFALEFTYGCSLTLTYGCSPP